MARPAAHKLSHEPLATERKEIEGSREPEEAGAIGDRRERKEAEEARSGTTRQGPGCEPRPGRGRPVQAPRGAGPGFTGLGTSLLETSKMAE